MIQRHVEVLLTGHFLRDTAIVQVGRSEILLYRPWLCPVVIWVIVAFIQSPPSLAILTYDLWCKQMSTTTPLLLTGCITFWKHSPERGTLHYFYHCNNNNNDDDDDDSKTCQSDNWRLLLQQMLVTSGVRAPTLSLPALAVTSLERIVRSQTQERRKTFYQCL